MYTLYYLNRNMHLGTIKVGTLDAPVLIPEDLVFCNFRSGVLFIKEPHECIDFTDTERLLIASEFSDMSTLKENDFRRANTYLNASCTIEQADEDPRNKCCGDGGEPQEPEILEIHWLDGSFEKDVLETYDTIVIPVGAEGTRLEKKRLSNNGLTNLGARESGNNDVLIEYTDTYEFVLRNISDNSIASNTIIAHRYSTTTISTYFGSRVCTAGVIGFVYDETGIHNFSMNKSWIGDVQIGDSLYTTYKCDELYEVTKFIDFEEFYINVVDGVITEKIQKGSICTRYCGEVNISAVFGEVVTLSYQNADGNIETQTWTAGGAGEQVYHSFGVGKHVYEPSVGIDAGEIIEIIYFDNL